MARKVQMQSIIDSARQRADQEHSTACTDDEILAYANDSIAEVYDLIVQVYGEDYYLASATFTTTPGTASYDIATITNENAEAGAGPAFYKLRRVDVAINGKSVTLAKTSLEDENYYALGGNYHPLRYRLHANAIVLSPPPDGAYTCTLYYVPGAPRLASAESWDGVNGWDEYVVVDVARKLATKEDNYELVAQLRADKAELHDRIVRMAPSRDAANPEVMRFLDDERDTFDRVVFGRWP